MMTSLFFKSSLAVNGILIAVCASLWFWGNSLAEKNSTLSASLEMKNKTIARHEENIIITERVSNDLQKSLDAVNARYDSLRNEPARCHPVTGNPGGRDGAAIQERLPEGNGLRSDWARLYARRAETDARRLIACQDFIRRTWKVNN